MHYATSLMIFDRLIPSILFQHANIEMWNQLKFFFTIIIVMFACVQEVDLTHGGLKVVPEVLGWLTHVEILSMRQNLIKDIGPIAELSTLRTLDLYDNELTATPDLSKMNALV